jgi:hypothetical protein
VTEQQEIDAHLKNNRPDGQIPHLPDLEPGQPRDQHRGQGKQNQPRHRAKQRRQRVANSLENAGSDKNNSRRNEIQRNDSKVFAAEGNDSRIARENANQRPGHKECDQREHQHHQRCNANCRIDGMPDSVRAAATEVLANHGRNGKAERNHRQKKRLHHTCANSEACLCCWSKASDDRVNDHDVHKEQQKLRAGWHTDPQHSSPNFCLRATQRKTKTQIMIFPFEINYDQHIGDENGNKRGKGRAGHSEFWPRTNSKNQ